MRLGKLITLMGGGTPSKQNENYWNGNVPWASVKDFKSNLISKTVDSISIEGVNNSATRIVPAGTLLVITRLASGKVAFAGVDMAFNQDIKAIECKAALDKRFLYYFLQSKSNYFERVASGATVKGIKINHINDIEINPPKLEAQKEIVAILDEADKLRQLDKALIAKYDQLAQSLFLEMFGDPVTNPKRWKRVKMNALCDFKKISVKPEDIYDSINYIPLDAIEKETGNIINIENPKRGEIKSNKFYFNESDILYGKLRPYLNKVALPNFEGICSSDIIPIKPYPNKSNRFFISTIMKNSGFVGFATERSSGANLPRISPKELEKYMIINPPFKLQNQFASQIQTIQAQKAHAQKALEKSEALFNSLLQRAFKGELVKE